MAQVATALPADPVEVSRVAVVERFAPVLPPDAPVVAAREEDPADVSLVAVAERSAPVPPPCAPVVAAHEEQLVGAAAAERKHAHLALVVAPALPHAQPAVNLRSALSAAAAAPVFAAPARHVALRDESLPVVLYSQAAELQQEPVRLVARRVPDARL